MSAFNFKKVIVIGYGVVTGNVLKTIYNKKDVYQYDIAYVEHEVYPFNQAKKFAEKKSIDYYVLEDKEKVTAYFLDETKEDKVLIISASNNYLFPAHIISRKNVTIINFHNALLPNYPGRNAPSWVIYNKEKETGITWHYVVESVDACDIIKQKKINIVSGIRAYELAAKLMDLASVCFEECIDNVLLEQVECKKQSQENNRRLYKSYEVPGEGCFRIDDNPDDIYRLLRAVDFGKNNIFPPIKSELDGYTIKVKRYKKTGKKEDVGSKGNKLFIPFEGEYLMIKYEILQG